MRDELTDSATFQVIVSPLENIPGIPTKALSAEFHELFKAVLLLHRHPRTLIQLVVQTTSKPPVATPTVNLSMNQPQEASSSEAKEPEKRRAPLLLGPDMPFEASEIAASINASTLALIDAAIPLRATVIATSCAVLEIDDALRTRDVDPSQKSHCVVVDPSPEEEKVALSCHVYAFAFSGYNALDASGNDESTAQLVYYVGSGSTSAKQRTLLFSTAEDAAFETLSHLRNSLAARIE